MVQALENLAADPTFLEFFGLTRTPFAELSRSPQIFHTEQYSLLMSHLANAAEQSDRLVVICGVDGSGKTTLLNRYIAGLGDDMCFATIDDTCRGEGQFYCAFLRQLGFSDITGTPHELRRITKEFLVYRGMAGDPVLMMIDNAHLVNPTVLEQLRWISAIKVNDRRVLSVILAGNSDLVRVMGSPAMIQTKFRRHVDFHIRVYTEEETANYVVHHLRLAGGSDAVQFSHDALALIHRYTGGIPKLINMLCNAVLTEAFAMDSHGITEDLVRTVADNRRLVPHVVPLQGRGRRRTDPDFKLVKPGQRANERIDVRDSTTDETGEMPTLRPEMPDVDGRDPMEQIAQLSEQVGELTADRTRALQDLGTRDRDISELRNQLDAQTALTDRLSGALEKRIDEIGRLNRALSESKKALQKKEKASKKLAADLKKARGAAKTAQTGIAKAKVTEAELDQLRSELQAAVSDLDMANERVGQIDALEENSAALKDEIENKTGELLTLRAELDSRDEAFVHLEKLLEESQLECASLRSSALALETLEKTLSEKNVSIESLEARLAECSQEIMALKSEKEELESRHMDVSSSSRAPVTDSSTEQSGTVVTAFEIARDGKTEQIIEIAEGQSRFMIGRSEDCELRLNAGFVSRHHALIFCADRETYIEDLNSFNGTIVNSKRITRCDLQAGDIVTVGDFQITPRWA